MIAMGKASIAVHKLKITIVFKFITSRATSTVPFFPLLTPTTDFLQRICSILVLGFILNSFYLRRSSESLQ